MSEEMTEMEAVRWALETATLTSGINADRVEQAEGAMDLAEGERDPLRELIGVMTSVQKADALVCAAGQGNDGGAVQLLAAGADPNAVASTGEENPVGNEEPAPRSAWLLGRRQGYTLWESYTPLTAAATSGHGQVLAVFLAAGANKDAQDGGGGTPLTCAAQDGREGVVETLLEAGCDVDSRDTEGNTPLLCAVYGGHGWVVQTLLEAGCNVDLRDIEGATSLIVAAFKNDFGIVKLLLKARADKTLMDANSWTALQYAEEGGHAAVAALLRE